MAGYSSVKKVRHSERVWQGLLLAKSSVEWQRSCFLSKRSVVLDLNVCPLFRGNGAVKSQALALRTSPDSTPLLLASNLRERSRLMLGDCGCWPSLLSPYERIAAGALISEVAAKAVSGQVPPMVVPIPRNSVTGPPILSAWHNHE